MEQRIAPKLAPKMPPKIAPNMVAVKIVQLPVQVPVQIVQIPAQVPVQIIQVRPGENFENNETISAEHFKTDPQQKTISVMEKGGDSRTRTNWSNLKISIY